MFSYSKIIQFRSIPTPFYYYDLGLLKETLDLLSSFQRDKGIRIHYAVKANANLPILQLIREHGLGADCVSGNEIRRSLGAGFAPCDVEIQIFRLKFLILMLQFFAKGSQFTFAEFGKIRHLFLSY